LAGSDKVLEKRFDGPGNWKVLENEKGKGLVVAIMLLK